MATTLGVYPGENFSMVAVPALMAATVPAADNSTELPPSELSCPVDKDYLPTVREYREALGAYHTALLCVGCLGCLLVFSLGLHRMWQHMQLTHKSYRRHVFWIISVFPVSILTSTLAILVPRANELCQAYKTVYMAIGVGRFIDLTLVMYGGENKMMEAMRGEHMTLTLPPACCCCRCLPSPAVTKRKLNLVKWIVWGLKWVAAVQYICKYLIGFGFQDSRGNVSGANGAYWYLRIATFCCHLSGVYCVSILKTLSIVKLERFRYKGKSISVKLMIITIKLQSAILDLIAVCGGFPCYGPYISTRLYKFTIRNTIVILESILGGILCYVCFQVPPPLPEYSSAHSPVCVGPATADLCVVSVQDGGLEEESSAGATVAHNGSVDRSGTNGDTVQEGVQEQRRFPDSYVITTQPLNTNPSNMDGKVDENFGNIVSSGQVKKLKSADAGDGDTEAISVKSFNKLDETSFT